MLTIENRPKREGTILFSDYKAGSGIKKAVEMGRENVLFELRESKLKGRGGAGFPTATKWMLTAAASGKTKFIVCNADEGEPGTFKDRVLLLEYPDLVFDGMVIAGFDDGVTGMVIGEKRTINIPADQAYGPKQEEMVMEFPKDRFPADMVPEVGMQLNMSNGSGQNFPVVIVEVKEAVVVLDANHPLAGEELVFDLELVSIDGPKSIIITP